MSPVGSFALSLLMVCVACGGHEPQDAPVDDEPAASSGSTGETDGVDACAHGDVGAVVPVAEGCCGCLCGQTGWSCATETCLEPDGTAAALAPEAGFFELESHEYAWAGVARRSARSRVWYSFWPAASAPQSRPLVLLFNGGPGASTGLLFGSNTGPYTLDPLRTDAVAATDLPWTEHFNLLYVDAPGTGFSYDLPLSDGSQVPLAIDPDRDASAFVSVLLRFLARHPAIQYNPVLLLGESYGGTRGTLMLQQLLEYETLVDDRSVYRNPSLYQEIERHLEGLAPGTCGRGVSREQVAAQFGHFVTVQGFVAGLPQLLGEKPPSPLCVPDGDPYHCNRPLDFIWSVNEEIGARLRRPDLLGTMLGVDPTSIAWMHAEARQGAYGREASADEGEMIAVFGQLDPGDAYYMPMNPAVQTSLGPSRDYLAEDMADVFLRVAATVDTFMTDARLDMVVATTALAPVLEARTHAVRWAMHDEDPREGVERPGWLRIDYVPGWAPGGVSTRELRTPRYDAAGHVVTLDEPESLLLDLVEWFEAAATSTRSDPARRGSGRSSTTASPAAASAPT